MPDQQARGQLASSEEYMVRKKYVEPLLKDKGCHHKAACPTVERRGQYWFRVVKLDQKVYALQQHAGATASPQQKVAARKASVWFAQGRLADVLQKRVVCDHRPLVQWLPHQCMHRVHISWSSYPFVSVRHYEEKREQKPMKFTREE